MYFPDLMQDTVAKTDCCTYFHDLMRDSVIKTDCYTCFCNLMLDTDAKTDCCTSVFDFPLLLCHGVCMFPSDKVCPLDLLSIGICELLFLCPFCVSTLKSWKVEEALTHLCKSY